MFSERQSGVEIVASYFYLHEADVAKALLESHGIEAWILDEHQIRQQWHLAGALGGIKVAVAPERAYRARQVLAEDHSDALQDIPEAALPASADERCPQCGLAATQIAARHQPPGALQWATSILWGLLGLLVPRRRIEVQRRCDACGHTWSTAETR